jgi:gliding motility-associated-like protein
LRTEDGAINQFNGGAYIAFETFNYIESASWFDENGDQLTTIAGNPIEDGSVNGLNPGEYFVSFVANNGCTYDADFIISTELQVYNFVTANGDSKNDYFMLDCIDYYPNNNVKIYTRAGQQVFEINRYNNFDRRFNGISDRGRDLPAGTYFYIIDRGDGSQLLQGYLELLR